MFQDSLHGGYSEGMAGTEEYRLEGPGVLHERCTLAGHLKLKWVWAGVVLGLSCRMYLSRTAEAEVVASS